LCIQFSSSTGFSNFPYFAAKLQRSLSTMRSIQVSSFVCLQVTLCKRSLLHHRHRPAAGFIYACKGKVGSRPTTAADPNFMLGHKIPGHKQRVPRRGQELGREERRETIAVRSDVGEARELGTWCASDKFLCKVRFTLNQFLVSLLTSPQQRTNFIR
jgi:hypothetical protein